MTMSMMVMIVLHCLQCQIGRQSLGEAISPMFVLSFAVTAMLTSNTDISKQDDDGGEVMLS